MKRLLAGCFAILLPLLLFAAPGQVKRIFLSWDIAPDYDSNVVFYVYTQTNVAMPVAGWSVLTNVDFNTFTANTNKVEIPAATTTTTFYVVTASNVFGESDFSDAVSTRRLGSAKNPKIGQL